MCSQKTVVQVVNWQRSCVWFSSLWFGLTGHTTSSAGTAAWSGGSDSWGCIRLKQPQRVSWSACKNTGVLEVLLLRAFINWDHQKSEVCVRWGKFSWPGWDIFLHSSNFTHSQARRARSTAFNVLGSLVTCIKLMIPSRRNLLRTTYNWFAFRLNKLPARRSQPITLHKSAERIGLWKIKWSRGGGRMAQGRPEISEKYGTEPKSTVWMCLLFAGAVWFPSVSFKQTSFSCIILCIHISTLYMQV